MTQKNVEKSHVKPFCTFCIFCGSPPHYILCFTHIFFRNFISGKFGVSDWMQNHRATVNDA